MKISKGLCSIVIIFLLTVSIFSISSHVYSQPASLTGTISDGGVDTDADGTYDYLEVGVEVDVTTAGMFLAIVRDGKTVLSTEDLRYTLAPPSDDAWRTNRDITGLSVPVVLFQAIKERAAKNYRNVSQEICVMLAAQVAKDLLIADLMSEDEQERESV